MRDEGVDCVLQPVYTPIRTDCESVADDRVFFGGIHIYLLQQLPWIRRIPTPVRRALDWSPLIRLATRRTHSTDSATLGQLTISMLRGAEGNQAGEVERLVEWLDKQMEPNAIVLSNLLIGGSLSTIRRRIPGARVVVLLQGDDIFLDHLPQSERDRATELCRDLVAHVDRFVVHSRFYAEKMGAMLRIPKEKFIVTPLSIDTKPFDSENAPSPKSEHEFRLGYLARIAPEKGLHRLVDTFIRLAGQPQHDDLSLHVAGWLGESNEAYLLEQQQKIEAAGLTSRFKYHGSPDLNEKVAFLRSLDLLCVPTDYEEPKGLFVLEALAASIPVVQPDHGAFGELIESTGGGLVVQPGNVEELGKAIAVLKADQELRLRLAAEGSVQVRAKHSIEAAAKQMKEILFE